MKLNVYCYTTPECLEEQAYTIDQVDVQDTISKEDLFNHFLQMSEELRLKLPEEISNGFNTCQFKITLNETTKVVVGKRPPKPETNTFKPFRWREEEPESDEIIEEIPVTTTFLFAISQNTVVTESSIDYLEDTKSRLCLIEFDFMDWMSTDKAFINYNKAVQEAFKKKSDVEIIQYIVTKLETTELLNLSEDVRYRTIFNLVAFKTARELKKLYHTAFDLVNSYGAKLINLPLGAVNTTLFKELRRKSDLTFRVADILQKVYNEVAGPEKTRTEKVLEVMAWNQFFHNMKH